MNRCLTGGPKVAVISTWSFRARTSGLYTPIHCLFLQVERDGDRCLLILGLFLSSASELTTKRRWLAEWPKYSNSPRIRNLR
jgi:hypothetical protein